MKKIYYWSPCLDLVGTVKSTINSAISLVKYSKAPDQFQVKVINSCGEWDKQKKLFKEKKVELINFFRGYYEYLPKKGYIQSRFSNIIIFFFSFLPLLKLLRKEKPDFLIIHLITSLPLLLLRFFSFETKFILRISGYPRLNFFRKFLWKIVGSKIYKVTCPSLDLISQLKEFKIFPNEKLIFLPDAVLNLQDLIEKKKINTQLEIENNFFLAVGRLTKQKNFSYLIDEFSEYLKIHPNQKLLIFGEGEQKNKLQKRIIKKGLEKNIFLKGNSKFIFNYMQNARAFILSSLWEEPGIVIIESAINNLFVISSDCKNGPREFLDDGNAGILFKNNSKDALLEKMLEFENLSKEEKKLKVFLAKKNSTKYSLFNHYRKLKLLLS
tara:strand:+ start:3234 stop:4379 length:1146 start_codon:yes stop_codon:yes gene_type:complete